MAVERKDIEIFFKIEGLESYITDLETLDSVLKQVDTATKQVKNTTNELETATDGFDDLEQRLQATEGAAKVLAGGLETLAGAAGLLGLSDNEFFKSLEQNTLSVIALARGTIDLTEGYAALRRSTILATAAQTAYNLAASANPYVLLAAAVATAASAIAGYTILTLEDTTATELNTAAKREATLVEEKLARLRDDLAIRASDIAALNKADREQFVQGIKDNIAITDSEIASLEESISAMLRASNGVAFMTAAEKDRFNSLQANLGLLREEKKVEEELIVRVNGIVASRKKVTTATDELNKKIEKTLELLPKIGFGKSTFEEDFEVILSRFEQVRQKIEDTKQLIVNTNTSITDSASKSADTFAVSYRKAFDQVLEEPGKASELLQRDVKAAIDFATNLNTIFTKDNEKRAERTFNLNKALGITSAVINTAEAVTAALTDKTQPSTILRIAQAAAVAAAGAAQIATISRTKFSPGSTDTPDVPTPLPPSGVNNPGTTMLPGQTTGETPSSIQGGPIRAYVLVSDVNSAQQANSQIENLVKL